MPGAGEVPSWLVFLPLRLGSGRSPLHGHDWLTRRCTNSLRHVASGRLHQGRRRRLWHGLQWQRQRTLRRTQSSHALLHRRSGPRRSFAQPRPARMGLPGLLHVSAKVLCASGCVPNQWLRSHLLLCVCCTCSDVHRQAWRSIAVEQFHVRPLPVPLALVVKGCFVPLRRTLSTRTYDKGLTVADPASSVMAGRVHFRWAWRYLAAGPP